MARRGRPSGRFFVWTAITSLAVYIAANAVQNRGGVPMPSRVSGTRAP